MTAWEYSVETINLEYKLDEHGNIKQPCWEGDLILEELLRQMGRDGWELAALVPAQPDQHFQLKIPKNPWVFYAVFKRPCGETD